MTHHEYELRIVWTYLYNQHTLDKNTVYYDLYQYIRGYILGVIVVPD